MTKLSVAACTALYLVAFGASPSAGEPSVEVMHFWTSGGEAAALDIIDDMVVAEGVTWIDTPVAGGGGDQSKTVLQARIAAGDPPAAMMMLGQNIINWANEGLLGNVDSLAMSEGWDRILPQVVQDFTKVDGHYVAVPTNVHRTDMIWASKAAFDRIGAEYPTSWEELNALAPRFIAAGIIPLAHGGQAWQEVYMFEAVVAGVAGADFYRRALVELDDTELRGPQMVAVFEQMAALRAMVDENAPGRDWNLATAMVINGDAAMQIMGDWAKGEFTNAGLVPSDDFACIPVPKANGDAFVYTINSLSLFRQTDPERLHAQGVLASVIMNPGVQVEFSIAKGAIPARRDVDASFLDACSQATLIAFENNGNGNTAVPTFAGTHAVGAEIVGAATGVITEFFNTDMSATDGATLLADSINAAK